MRRALQKPAALSDAMYQFNIFDDFNHYVIDDTWTHLETNSGAVAVADAANGVITLTTDTADNDDAQLFTSTELFLWGSGLTQEVTCRLDFTEVATSGQIIGFGLQSAVAADAMQDAALGPAASKDFAMIYKVDGELVWRCGAALAAGTNPANLSTMSSGRTNSKTVAYQTLKIRCEANGTALKVTYSVDPVGLGGFEPLVDSNGTVIEDAITIASPTEMALMVTVKAGSAAAHSLLVDYLAGSQTRLASVGGR